MGTAAAFAWAPEVVRCPALQARPRVQRGVATTFLTICRSVTSRDPLDWASHYWPVTVIAVIALVAWVVPRVTHAH